VGNRTAQWESEEETLSNESELQIHHMHPQYIAATYVGMLKNLGRTDLCEENLHIEAVNRVAARVNKSGMDEGKRE
jgi:hypothetical protein